MNAIKIIIISSLLFLNISAKTLDKVTIQLDWLHQFQFAGYYIAKEKGFYKENNIDVTIKEFDFDINILDDVLYKENLYAVGKSSLIIDKLEGKNIVLLSAIYQNSPMVLISLKKSNIYSPKDLKNKHIMMTPDARTAASINSMIISQGLNLSDIKFQKHSFNLEDLISGKTDAMASYLSNEPFHLKEKNIDFVIHDPSKYGFDFYGGIFYTSKKELDKNPLRVKKIYDATLKGWKYAFENIEETAKLIYEKYNTQNKSLKSLIFEGETLKKLAKFEQGLLGDINTQKIEEIKRLYLLSGSTNKMNSNLDGFIYSPNKILKTKHNEKFLKTNQLTLVTNDSYPPFTMKTNNELSGIEIDYWNLINKKLDIKNPLFKIENSVRQNIKLVVENQNFLKYSFSKYDKKSKLKETIPIANIKIGIATKYNKPYISDLYEIKDKKIAIAKNSLHYDQIKKLYPNIDFIKIDNLEEAIKQLNKEKVYAVIAKVPAISYIITKNNYPKIKISGTIEDIDFKLKLTLNPKNEKALKLLNDAIALISDEERQSINNKYYSIVYQNQFDYNSFFKVVIPLILIIIIVLINNQKLKKEVKNRKKIEKKLHNVANFDSLTNIYNRRKIESLYNSEIIRAKRYNIKLSVIFFDIDNFKNINDQFGHAIGDETLKNVANIVKMNLRTTDYFGRWGGEEFVIILTETSKEKASNVAHLIKERISSNDFELGNNITCSFGVAQFEETDSADSLLTRADNAMYYVKRNGKNNVKVV